MVVSPRAWARGDFRDGMGTALATETLPGRASPRLRQSRIPAPALAAALFYRPILSPFAFPLKPVPALITPKVGGDNPHSPSNERSDVWFIWIQLSNSKISQILIPLRDALAGCIAQTYV